MAKRTAGQALAQIIRMPDTVTADELAALAGLADDLTALDGLSAELALLSGLTATAAELNAIANTSVLTTVIEPTLGVLRAAFRLARATGTRQHDKAVWARSCSGPRAPLASP